MLPSPHGSMSAWMLVHDEIWILRKQASRFRVETRCKSLRYRLLKGRHFTFILLSPEDWEGWHCGLNENYPPQDHLFFHLIPSWCCLGEIMESLGSPALPEKVHHKWHKCGLWGLLAWPHFLLALSASYVWMAIVVSQLRALVAMPSHWYYGL